MGLFSRRGSRAQAGWRPDGTGVESNGDCGGDIQVGDSYSVRFVRDDKPGSLITVSFYATGDRREYDVERQVEWMVCGNPADPGGTEIWSDASSNYLCLVAIRSAAEAEQEAREFAEAALEDAESYAGWDGEPRWGAA